ncbi:MAG: universal stress protein [Flavobacteriales bacterium]|nr:universal stress protein [Flavobacteriales bacterium]
MKIIFPTDLSDESLENIINVLPALVNKEKETEVIFFHTVEQPTQGATLMMDITKILKTDAINQMEGEKKKIAEKLGITIRPEVRVGYYDVELRDFVLETKPDLVVLISKAKHGIMRYISGQRSLKFVGELAAPLLIIPENLDFTQMRKFGIGVDETEDPTMESMGRIKQLSGYYETQVEMMHIYKDKIENQEYYDRISETSDFGDVQMVTAQKVEEGIKKWCMEKEIDVLIMLTHDKNLFQRTFGGSVSREIVKNNMLSLLIINQSFH